MNVDRIILNKDEPVSALDVSLQAQIPNLPKELHEKKEMIALKDEISSPINLPYACRFAKRCNYCCEDCTNAVVGISPNHFVACYHPLIIEG